MIDSATRAVRGNSAFCDLVDAAGAHGTASADTAAASIAKTVIEAMREPTEAMVTAAFEGHGVHECRQT